MEEGGYRFEVVTAAVEESLPAHLTVRECVLLNARRKGGVVAALRPEAWVVAADTLVALKGEALGKPGSLEEAQGMLKRLSGRTHQVFSGVWMEHREARTVAAFIEVSHVRFRELSGTEIEEYCRVVHVMDKAGSYAAQEDPMGVIAEIEGSRTNVIGLPMERLGAMLAARGYGGNC
jgi:septum formation protein